MRTPEFRRAVAPWTFAIGLLLASLSAPAAAPRFDDPDVQDALAALKREPTIQQAQASALQFFNVDPGTVSSMRSRANWKSVLPRVNVEYRQADSTYDIDRTNLLTSDEPFQLDDAKGNVVELRAGGSWDLPRLVFNSEVLDVSSLAVLQEGVLKEVTRLYYTRRRLQVDLILNPPQDPASALSKSLRIEELTATLDAMTGNLFSKRGRQE